MDGVPVDACRQGVADHADLGVDQRGGHRAAAGAFAAEAQVAGPGLGRHQRDRHPLADVAALEVGIDQEGVFVDRPQHAGALGRANHDRPGMPHELAERRQRALGLVDVDDRMRVFGKAGNLVGHADGPGRDQQIVVEQHVAVFQIDLDDVGLDALDCAVDELDAARFQIGRNGEGDVGALAPAHGDPGIGRHEVEVGLVRHHRHFVARAQFGFQGIGRGHARDAGTQDDNMRHFSLLDSLRARCFSRADARAARRARRRSSQQSRSTHAPDA